MEYFQTAWQDGSVFNKGLLAEEFFYNQIFDAIEVNVANKTLPFFNQKANSIPVELTTGKLINDENLIALEQIAAKYGYESNVWIYGDTLEKMRKEGIRLNTKKGTDPALCMTKYANATHIIGDELYIAEAGTKTKAQFLYNYDSLDERSKLEVDKYFKKAKEICKVQTNENFKNFLENKKQSQKEIIPRLQTMKNRLRNVAEKATETYKRSNPSHSTEIDFKPIMNAQITHMCQVSTGAFLRSTPNSEKENVCYDLLSRVIENTKSNNSKKWAVGQTITKVLDASNNFAKSWMSKNFDREIRKNKEEQSIKQENLKKRKIDTDIEY